MNKPVDKEQVHADHQQQPDKKVVNDYAEAVKSPQHGHTTPSEKHTEKHAEKPWEKSSVPSPK